jgi:vacuolar-type H+-ATPase subunit I/STV1
MYCNFIYVNIIIIGLVKYSVMFTWFKGVLEGENMDMVYAILCTYTDIAIFIYMQALSHAHAQIHRHSLIH